MSNNFSKSIFYYERRLQELRQKAIWDENSAYATGEKRGELKGFAMGKSIGEKRGKIKTARAMFKNNIKREIIAKCTGINVKELDKLLGPSLEYVR